MSLINLNESISKGLIKLDQHASQIWSLYLVWFKRYSSGKSVRLADEQTDRSKSIPRLIDIESFLSYWSRCSFTRVTKCFLIYAICFSCNKVQSDIHAFSMKVTMIFITALTLAWSILHEGREWELRRRKEGEGGIGKKEGGKKFCAHKARAAPRKD